jgi:hypothetical protein
MAKVGDLHIRISEKLEKRMVAEIERLRTDKTKWVVAVLERALEPVVVTQGGRAVTQPTIVVTQADIQRQLDELYKRKKVLGNGVEMPGTYVDIGGEGELLSKPGVEGVEGVEE